MLLSNNKAVCGGNQRRFWSSWGQVSCALMAGTWMSTSTATEQNPLSMRVPSGWETCLTFKALSLGLYSFTCPSNGCGTRPKFKVDKVICGKEIHAVWTDLPPSTISRHGEFRKASGVIRAGVPCWVSEAGSPCSCRPPQMTPTCKPVGTEYPVARHLHQPVSTEGSVLDRTDHNIQLVLEDCWQCPPWAQRLSPRGILL